MEFNRLFISNTEKYIAGYYFDIELYQNNDTAPVFLSTLGNLKNPHIVAFSKDDYEVLIKSNDNIMEIYDLSTMKKIFRCSGSRADEENAFLLDEVIIICTNDGSVCSIERRNKKRALLRKFGDYTYSQLYHIKEKSYVFLGYNEITNTTDLHYFDIIDKVITETKTYASSFKLLAKGVYRYGNTDYFMSGNKLISLDHNQVAIDAVAFDFEACDLSYQSDIAEVNEILKSYGMDNQKMNLVRIAGFGKYLFVAYHRAVFIFDLETKTIRDEIKTNRGITDIAVSVNNKQLWISSPFGTQSIDIVLP